jgi:hypothetical protein
MRTAGGEETRLHRLHVWGMLRASPANLPSSISLPGVDNLKRKEIHFLFFT